MDVDVAERSVDRVVVDTEGLSHPVDVRAIDGRDLPEGPRQAVFEVLASDTWPSWDYE